MQSQVVKPQPQQIQAQMQMLQTMTSPRMMSSPSLETQARTETPIEKFPTPVKYIRIQENQIVNLPTIMQMQCIFTDLLNEIKENNYQVGKLQKHVRKLADRIYDLGKRLDKN